MLHYTHCWILPGNTVPHRDGDWAKGKLRIHRWLWQDCSIPSALAMEELQSCTKPSIYGKAFQNETNMWLEQKIARSNKGVFKSIQNWFQQNVLKSSKTIHCTKTSNVKPLLKIFINAYKLPPIYKYYSPLEFGVYICTWWNTRLYFLEMIIFQSKVIIEYTRRSTSEDFVDGAEVRFQTEVITYSTNIQLFLTSRLAYQFW